MAYTYKMVQIPPNIEVNKKEKHNAAAYYLQNVVNEYAENWCTRKTWLFSCAIWAKIISCKLLRDHI